MEPNARFPLSWSLFNTHMLFIIFHSSENSTFRVSIYLGMFLWRQTKKYRAEGQGWGGQKRRQMIRDGTSQRWSSNHQKCQWDSKGVKNIQPKMGNLQKLLYLKFSFLNLRLPRWKCLICNTGQRFSQQDPNVRFQHLKVFCAKLKSLMKS